MLGKLNANLATTIFFFITAFDSLVQGGKKLL